MPSLAHAKRHRHSKQMFKATWGCCSLVALLCWREPAAWGRHLGSPSSGEPPRGTFFYAASSRQSAWGPAASIWVPIPGGASSRHLWGAHHEATHHKSQRKSPSAQMEGRGTPADDKSPPVPVRHQTFHSRGCRASRSGPETRFDECIAKSSK